MRFGLEKSGKRIKKTLLILQLILFIFVLKDLAE